MTETMTTVPCAAGPSTDRRIVIVGGGYAGTTLAVRLGKSLAERRDLNAEVLLVEPNPCQQALSELDLVAVGPDRPEFCELWLPAVLKDLPVRTCYNRVENVDTANGLIRTEGGHEVEFWRVAICTGAVPNLPPIPGLNHGRAVTMWSVSDAQELQRRISEQFKKAARMPDLAQRRAALSFTVCGGGATGIEIIGTMGQLLPKRAQDVGLDREDLQMHIVEGRPDILYDLSESQRAKAADRLRKLGVDLVTGSLVSEVLDDEIVLADGRTVPAAVLVWCGGAAANPSTAEWGFDIDNARRIIVGPDLKAQGHDDVYVLGDAAAFRDPKTHHTLPMLAQYAIREAEHACGNIIRELEGRPAEAFHPHLHGEFVSIGPSWGIGWAGRFKLAGIPAIIMKRLTYIMYWWQVGGIGLAWNRARELLAMQR